ncbi:hypothetical protein PHLGIDRAFT_226951 [Phlebiopsis gigantea 11061_1 CR5-6]|uniref:Uncharacterized protein n=1 Tax=Phlebiopsis gigantea (strain 11061_1 CR5-6) TaxID=745531 RepID=A0A0C3RT32_PHLG1|nr:hypothetical protein PHLGIDRAFT_226951 [Phlebiopsis gigantea 11061_1 CR5-6]
MGKECSFVRPSTTKSRISRMISENIAGRLRSAMLSKHRHRRTRVTPRHLVTGSSALPAPQVNISAGRSISCLTCSLPGLALSISSVVDTRAGWTPKGSQSMRSSFAGAF